MQNLARHDIDRIHVISYIYMYIPHPHDSFYQYNFIRLY